MSVLLSFLVTLRTWARSRAALQLDHVIVFHEAGLQQLMTLYGSYYERSRTHVSLDKDTPIPRPVMPPGDDAVVVIPEVGGLHHR